MSNNNTTYTRTSQIQYGHIIISTYCSVTNDIISDETFYNNVLSQKDEYTNKNGIIYKIQQKFYDNTNLSEFSEFIAGVRVGIHKKYYNNGTLQFIKNYNTTGRLHGISTIYHPDGTLVASTNYDEGNIV